MIQPLKHYALRLWATLVVGGPAILFLLTLIGTGLSPALTLTFAGAVLLVLFWAVGAVFHLLGRRGVESQMRAAEDWERDGSTEEAEACYRRALAALSSFLPPPRVRKRIFPQLADRLARFYKVRPEQRIVSEDFIGAYLQMHPEDEELARIWLRQAGSRGWLERKDQELAARIGAALSDSPAIQALLARYCLMEERSDFAALETYRRLMAFEERNVPADLTRQIAEMFVSQGRADKWALPAYIRAFEQDPENATAAAGIAACLSGLGETQKNRHWIAAGRRLLEGADPLKIEEGIGRFQVTALAVEPPRETAERPSGTLRSKIGTGAVSGLRQVSAGLAAAGRRLADGVRWARKTPAARKSLRWGALTAAAIAAVFLVVNTAGYLMRSEKRPEPAAPAVVATGRFTIQVAAYLKEEHARRYADELEKHGLDVYWTESSGDQKRWYQVRISRFEDKAAARAYGDTLKANGIIEDYYIANYSPPAD